MIVSRSHSDAPPGPLMLDVQGLELSAREQEMLLRPEVGGVILFSRNFASRAQLSELVAALRELRPQLLLAVDQEGGRVQRLQQGFTRLPPMRRLGELYEQDAGAGLDLARACGWLMAAEVLQIGLDFSFAPVLDLYWPQSRVIADRAFSADAAVTVQVGLAFIEGMHEAGMIATGKHYPGHGNVVADSHLELPIDTRSAEQIEQTDLAVFRACAGKLDAIMPAHVCYPAFDSLCAGFSAFWLQQMLRGELDFQGIIFSDDLTMAAAAAGGAMEARLELALAAGCNMVLVCNNSDLAVSAADWLQRQGVTGDPRLQGLRGQACESGPLQQSPRWRQTRAQLSELGPTSP